MNDPIFLAVLTPVVGMIAFVIAQDRGMAYAQGNRGLPDWFLYFGAVVAWVAFGVLCFRAGFVFAEITNQ